MWIKSYGVINFGKNSNVILNLSTFLFLCKNFMILNFILEGHLLKKMITLTWKVLRNGKALAK